MDVEQVPAGGAQGRVAFLDAPQPDRLDRVDAERLDDRLPALHPMSIGASAGGRPGGAEAVIEALRMRAHPEGGWYAETWRAAAARTASGRAAARSSICWRPASGRTGIGSMPTRCGSTRRAVRSSSGSGPRASAAITVHRLGGDVPGGDAVQAVVPAGAWQAARPLGEWTLVGCIVTPAFEFAGFELAPAGWEPPV